MQIDTITVMLAPAARKNTIWFPPYCKVSFSMSISQFIKKALKNQDLKNVNVSQAISNR
jgi:hypothetical protein